MAVYCGECKNICRLTTGKEIYPHRKDLHKKSFYKCSDPCCGAYIGCHPNSDKALGSPAGYETRKLRSKVHDVFDPIWRNKIMTRQGAYSKLAWCLGIEREKCHVGMFDFSMCQMALTEIMNWGISPEFNIRSKKNG
jgi:hypothetical protein